jgi:S-formylglutathione hydrolase FrmB
MTFCTESHLEFWVYLIFQSVSAFAPIANPINCPWGQKAFSNYLGPTKSDWEVFSSLEITYL